MKTISINSIINDYRSVSAIRKNQETIMQKYGIELKKDFASKVLKPCQAKINEQISAKFVVVTMDVIAEEEPSDER